MQCLSIELVPSIATVMLAPDSALHIHDTIVPLCIFFCCPLWHPHTHGYVRPEYSRINSTP